MVGWYVEQGSGPLDLQMVAGEGDHPEIQLSAVCSRNSRPPLHLLVPCC